MTAYDAFNGDADGICALLQLRLARPLDGVLVTGVKRDIGLLARVPAGDGDEVAVLDVSLDTNRADLIRILDAGARVTYVDHHFSGVVPDHPALTAHLRGSHDVCTSLLVDEVLGGAQRSWALVGAFGDGLDAAASALAGPGISPAELDGLRELGRLVNYNAYGRTVEDLHFPPDRLYRMLLAYPDPREFVVADPAFRRLADGYASDMSSACGVRPAAASPGFAVYILPDAAWSRRISGALANQLARQGPEASYAIVVPNTAECCMVSVRVPPGSPRRADDFCRLFETGGGRAAAGGINHLPRRDLDDFVRRFASAFS